MRIIDADLMKKKIESLEVDTNPERFDKTMKGSLSKSGFGHWQHCNGYNCALGMILIEIDNAQTVKNEKHGHWDEENEVIGGFFHSIRTCSQCGWTYDMVIEFNYCPNCGAEMCDSENK